MSDWSEWVLDHGLPPLPEVLNDGEVVPVARWAGSRFGAVLRVSRYWDDDDGEDRLDSEVEVFRRTDTGWQSSNGGGGSGWFDPPFERPGLGPREVVGGHEHCSGGPEWSCCAVDGIAGADAVRVEVIDAAGVERQPIESPFGAFIACSDGERAATVRILDADELVVLSWTFGGQFDLQRVPPAFAGFAEFLPGSTQGQPGSDEIGVIQVSTREATSEGMRHVVLHAAHGPSGLPPSLRDRVKVRLEGGDDPSEIARWLMTVMRERGKDGDL
jgi:hypothetical protein